MSHGFPGDVFAPKSKLYQGPFGRIFPDLDAWSLTGVPDNQIDRHLLSFANQNMLEAPGKRPGEIAANDNLRNQLEAEFSSSIPAAYTYFGQFVDHDITFDPTSSLARQNDPEKLANFRTPRLDLDNLYGRGPDDQPYLYQHNSGGKFLIGSVIESPLPDLPRNREGIAVIGDPRNDENSIVCQIQLAFLLAHNALFDRAIQAGSTTPFDDARRTLRRLYQWILWHDFLPRIVLPEVLGMGLRLETKPDGSKVWSNQLKHIFNWKHQPFMPIEFSGAAYRFGHSMVRNSYQTNLPHRGFGSFAPIFDNVAGTQSDDLRGFRPLPLKNYLQWDWFLKMTSSAGPFPQRARKIDTKLSNALGFLFEGPTGSAMNVLAFRNLKRGLTFSLPSGSNVARKFGFDPIPLTNDEPDALWYYILKEAASQTDGESLGKVGSIIVAATFAGLLIGDPNSFFSTEPGWTPDREPLLNETTDRVDSTQWELSSIIRLAGLPVDASGFPPQLGT